VQVVITSWFCVFILAAAIYLAAVRGESYRYLFCLAGAAAFYTAWNTFISGANPSRVIVDRESISFVSFRKTERYLYREIHTFLAKDFRGSGKIFLRINRPTLFKGRYWIHAREFNDAEELFLFILKLEYNIHPGSMKARAWDSTRPDVDKTLFPRQ